MAAVSPAAAIDAAAPTSPWQPTSAPEMDAFILNKPPMAVAVRKKRLTCRLTPASLSLYSSKCARSTAGTMPAAPFVGAVTNRPPAAFSSLTAIAYTIARCAALAGALSPWELFKSRCHNVAARLFTLRPPGSSPSAQRPRSIQSLITLHSLSDIGSNSSRRKQTCSFLAWSSAMDNFSRSQRATNSSIDL